MNMRMTKSNPVPFPSYLTLANPRGRGCFHGRGFLPAFPIPRMNEWLHREKRSGPEEPFFALCPFMVPVQHRRHDASSNWKRCPEMRRNEGESANARGMLRSLLKGRGSPNKKGVSFSETAYRANWVRRDSFSLFPLVSPPSSCLIFDQLWKLNVHTLSNVFNDRRKVSLR